jgi:EAL domain-containing protein (putative c-di-GMP-specific phosphodiesterase class I)
VDQGFVHGAASNDTLRAICYASLSLAQQMGMKTVAEGVEDQADWDFLRSTSCDLAQGYFIAKPMPAAEIPDWISVWESNIENIMKSSSVR